MSQIENSAIERKSKSFTHTKKRILRIDMTPMVDLGFLLITFFVFTTSLSTPKAADLFMPKEGDPTNLPNSLALSVLLGDNNEVYYYQGDLKDAISSNQVFKTSFSTLQGIGKVIRQKQSDIVASKKFTDGSKGLMLLIKPTSASVYKNVIDALDEIMINDVRKYALVEPEKEELEYLKKLKVTIQ